MSILLIMKPLTYSFRDKTEKRKEKYEAIVNTKETIAMELLSNNLASPEWILQNVIMNKDDYEHHKTQEETAEA